MISTSKPIGPSGPSNPPGDTPDVTATAKVLAAELDTAIAELSNLKLQNLEPQVGKMAQLFTDLSAHAQKALQAAGR
jgi:hypothetical protein